MNCKKKALFLIPASMHSKNVARDLLYGCWCKGKRIAGIQFPPLSQVLAATVVRDSGIPVDVIDAGAMGLSIPDLQGRIGDYFCVVILTSNMTYNEDVQLLSLLKARNGGLISIVYGGFVTALPDAALKRSSVDVVVRREPEITVRSVVERIYRGEDIENIKGISYRGKNGLCHNEDAALIEDLDSLPAPDRRLLPANIDYFNPIVKRMPFTTMFTSRGCPGQCTFCSSPTFYGRKIRFRSAESVLGEIGLVMDMGYREVFFRDEIFSVSRQRVFDICEGILRNGYAFSWICSARIGTLDREMMQIMKRAGCHMIRLGVESGVQRLLDNVKKGIKIEQTVETFRLAREAGLDTHAHMMIGLPGETKETLKETARFIIKIDPTIATFGIMTPYAGTPLFEQLIKKYPELGDTTQADLGTLHTKSFYNEYFTDMKGEDLAGYIHKIYKKFYLRPSYVLKWMGRITSLEELKRVSLAATQVIDFALSKRS